MSKYHPLTVRLDGQKGPDWRVSFAELEAVLGFPLPKRARSAQSWWSNLGSEPHQRAWMLNGWEVGQVDIPGGHVTFRKKGATPAIRNGEDRPTGTEEPAILSRLDASPKWGVALIAGSVALVAGIGALALRGFWRRR